MTSCNGIAHRREGHAPPCTSATPLAPSLRCLTATLAVVVVTARRQRASRLVRLLDDVSPALHALTLEVVTLAGALPVIGPAAAAAAAAASARRLWTRVASRDATHVRSREVT